MAAKEEDSVFVEKINRVIPFLNGIEPETLEEVDYASPKPAKSVLYGPNVGIVKKNRYLALLYIGKRIQLLRDDGEQIEGLVYFSPRKILRIANYTGFKPHKIKFERTRAAKQYMEYKDEGLIDHRPGAKDDLFAITEKGEQYCIANIDLLDRAALPGRRLRENEKVY